MRRMTFTGLAFVALFCVPALIRADVKPHGLFSDNMVLQRGTKAAIWGTADDGEEITVRFRDHKATATAEKGKWLVRIDTGDAGGPFQLTIAGKNTIELKNVLVGEVWIA